MPLYFAGATDLPPGTPPVRKELIAAGARVVDPTTIVNQGVVRQYPVHGKCMNGESRRQGNAVRWRSPFIATCFRSRPLDVNPDGRMEIVWGTRTDPTNAKWMRLTDSDGTIHGCDLEDRLLQTHLPGLLRSG